MHLVISNRIHGEDWVLAVLPITAFCAEPLDAFERDVNIIVEVACPSSAQP